jgi:hypothetical protein
MGEMLFGHLGPAARAAALLRDLGQQFCALGQQARAVACE